MPGSSGCLGPAGSMLLSCDLTQVAWFAAVGNDVCREIWHHIKDYFFTKEWVKKIEKKLTLGY